MLGKFRAKIKKSGILQFLAQPSGVGGKTQSKLGTHGSTVLMLKRDNNND